MKSFKAYFAEEETWMINKHVEICLTTLIIREMHSKTKKRCYHTTIGIVKVIII